jgi:hypothetical protein
MEATAQAAGVTAQATGVAPAMAATAREEVTMEDGEDIAGTYRKQSLTPASRATG